MPRTPYQDLYNLFESKECHLLMTKEEYDEKHLVKQDIFRYIAKCGHTNSVRGTNFMNNSGIYCKACAHKSPKSKNQATETIIENDDASTSSSLKIKNNGASKSSSLEISSQVKKVADVITNKTIIKKLLEVPGFEQHFTWKLTPDNYSTADIFVRQWEQDSDFLMRVHVGYSLSENVARFTVNSNTPNDVMFCISRNIFWLMERSEFVDIKSFQIRLKGKSLYDQYKISLPDVVPKLLRIYQSKMGHNINETNKKYVNTYTPDNSLTFETIVERITKKNCKVLTTKEEFEIASGTTKTKLQIQMTCNHTEEISVHLFKKRKHLCCQQCIYKLMKPSMYDEENRVASGNMLESQAFDYIKTIIGKDFVVMKTHEGCRADMAIKPIGHLVRGTIKNKIFR